MEINGSFLYGEINNQTSRGQFGQGTVIANEGRVGVGKKHLRQT